METLDGGNQKILKFPTEGLVQQRLLKRLQRGVLPLVEAGEALGFFADLGAPPPRHQRADSTQQLGEQTPTGLALKKQN